MDISQKAMHVFAGYLLIIAAISSVFSGCATPPIAVSPPVKIKEVTPSRLPNGYNRLLASFTINQKLVISNLHYEAQLRVYESDSSGKLRRVNRPNIRHKLLKFDRESCIIEMIYPPSRDSGYSIYGYALGLYVAKEIWPAEGIPKYYFSEARSEPGNLVEKFPFPIRAKGPSKASNTKPPSKT